MYTTIGVCHRDKLEIKNINSQSHLRLSSIIYVQVEPRGRPQFPRSTGEWWFGCSASNLAQKRLPFGGLSHDGRPLSMEDEFRREPLSPSLSAQDDNSDDNLDMNVRNEMIETDDTNSLWSLHSDNSDTTSPKIYGTHINDGSLNNEGAGTTAATRLVPSSNHYYFQPSLSSPSSSSSSSSRSSLGTSVNGACFISSLLISIILLTCNNYYTKQQQQFY